MNFIERQKGYYSKFRFGGNRDEVLKRDKKTCQLCNSKDGVIVHHKIDINHNNLEDLICLCWKCHYIVHNPTPLTSNRERALEIKKLRESGLTLQKIGNNYNISRERVRQILKSSFLLVGS